MSSPKSNSIKLWQIKRIHVLLNRIGVTDQDYRTRLQDDYGVSTCKQLSSSQAGKLIKNMESIAKGMGIDSGRRRRREWKRRPGMATPAQLRKIEAMWADVSRQKTPGERRKALGAFLEKRFGVSDLAFVTHEMPGKIIHTLETMKKQKQAERIA